MRKKRIADWLEKISAAFVVGAFLAEKGFWVPMLFGLFIFWISFKLTDRS